MPRPCRDLAYNDKHMRQPSKFKQWLFRSHYFSWGKWTWAGNFFYAAMFLIPVPLAPIIGKSVFEGILMTALLVVIIGGLVGGLLGLILFCDWMERMNEEADEPPPTYLNRTEDADAKWINQKRLRQ